MVMRSVLDEDGFVSGLLTGEWGAPDPLSASNSASSGCSLTGHKRCNPFGNHAEEFLQVNCESDRLNLNL